MIPLKEKLDKEKENGNCIYLYKEGAFWRAYGVSCMLFYRMFPHIKVLANKTQDKGYVLCGIPDTKIEEYHQKLLEKQARIIQNEENTLPLEGVKKEVRVYQCAEKINAEEYEAFLYRALQKQREKEKPAKIVVIPNERMAYLIQRIKQIKIEELTPVQALVELEEIKRYVRDLGI